ncbi:proprotein convertase P-domain-containing protein [Polaribacter sp. SA4-12]|uniref:proprotein convertase P-domain-containing protein n=1 Tax=Polaribacter sp. SA4-12 TaxID=1312072 RepID=UPI000B3CF775|nr:proprotein convertase P-domain-containing protein [Polaribacter sp. SA4-12]ARV16271.1 hypothetical protein BTO07_14455 [Polaribacter sp. SA4-12]
MLKRTHNKYAIEFLLFIFFLISIKSFGQNICRDYSETPSTTISSSGSGSVYNTTINVPDSYTLTDVNITVDITHTYNDDLDIFLVSPLGTRVELSTDNGGKLNNYENVIFNDDSTKTLPKGNSALSGDYQPEGSLTTFNGENSNGNWVLEITDDANQDGGTINEVILNLCYSTPITPGSEGYLGPGGVGNTDGSSDLEVWYLPNNMRNADILPTDGQTVSTWLDASGNNKTATNTGTAVYTEGIINGYATLTATALNRQFVTANNVTAKTILVVNNPKTRNSFETVIGLNGDKSIRRASSGDNNWQSPGNGANNDTWSTNTGSSFVNGSATNTGTHNNQIHFISQTRPTTYESKLYLGGTYNGRTFTGDISEVIIFDRDLNLAEKIIIDNYVSAKYDIALVTNDFYNEDDNGDFDHKVAGIGQASDGSNHTDSQGTGIIRINTPKALSDGDFLFWGEDVKDATYDFSSSVSTNYLERLDTKWKVSKRNNLGSVSVSINASDLDLSKKSSCASLQLVVDNTSDFSSITKTTYNLSLSKGVYTATEVSFLDDDYFTLEYFDTIVVDDSQFYNGSGALNVPDITDDCYKLLVKSTANGTLSLTENADVREVEVEYGGKLVVNTGYRLKVANGINNNGDIRLVGTSQLIQTHTTGTNFNTGSGNLYVDQNSDLTSIYRYNYWSSPVKEIGTATFTVKGVMKDGTTPTSATSTPLDLTFTSGYDGSTSPLTLSSYWIYGYLNGLDGTSWSQKHETGTFNPGEGYLLKSPGSAQNYTFKGVPNDGDISFSIDADNTSLLGNPYPSAINVNQLFADSSNLATLYFWEHHNETNKGNNNQGHYKSGYIGGYSYRNSTMGIAANSNINGITGLGNRRYTAPGEYIAIGQGFFAETATGLAATVNFKNQQRAFITEAEDSHFFRTENIKEKNKSSEYAILKFGFEAKNSDDIYIHSQVGISFSKGKTFATETGFDSKKVEIKDSDIYFQFDENGEKLVIAGVQEIKEDLLVPITLKIGTTEDIFIVLDEKENISNNVFIFDIDENIYYNTSNPIVLNLPKGTYSNRFFITFNDQVLSIEDELLNRSFNVYQNSKTKELVVKNINKKIISNISVYTFTGQKIINLTDNEVLKNAEITFKTNKISTSVYIVNIATSEGVISKKILIK